MNYRALVIRENEGIFTCKEENLTLKDLDTNDVLIRVKYSALNFKDALSMSGNKGVTKSYPHTPGIDGSGIVERSSDPRFHPGQEVVVTGFDMGMNTAGAMSEYISVPANWVVPLPSSMDLAHAATLGTAGITAAIGLDKMEKYGLQKGAHILITGASGAVGSIAVALFRVYGYKITALSSKPQAAELLKELGANSVIDSFETENPRPLLKPQFDGAFDVVGGKLLASVLKQVSPEGCVACCGLVGGVELPTTVLPFILNGVGLLGVNSATYPTNKRANLWKLLEKLSKKEIEPLVHSHPLKDVPQLAKAMLEGQSFGRALIKI
jgi:putative YhdH/YhfP family quinone oxidoreductase